MAEPVPRDNRLTALWAASHRGAAVPAELVALPNGRAASRALVHQAFITPGRTPRTWHGHHDDGRRLPPGHAWPPDLGRSGAAAVACLPSWLAPPHGVPDGSAVRRTRRARTTARRDYPADQLGSATVTLAARLATLPATSSAHGSTPPLRPYRESASSVVDAATIMPSTDSGVSALPSPAAHATPRAGAYAGRPSRRPAPKRNAANRGPPDTQVRARGHYRLLTANSPASTHWDLGAIPPRTQVHGPDLLLSVCRISR
jgi:hypothetical protein